MLVKDVIKQLQNEKWYKPDDNLMIGWCDSDAVNGDGRMTPELWEEACALADNSEYLFDRQVAADIVKETEQLYPHLYTQLEGD